MAAIYLLILSLLTLTLTPKPILSLPLHKIPNFDPDIALLGDAEIVDAGSSVHLTRPTPSSSGLLLNAKPLTFLQPTSFSTDFSFSSDGLALVLAPADLPQKFPAESNSPFGIPRGSKLFAVEFDASTHDVVSVRVSNVSSPLNLAHTNGVKGKVQAWVDYVASAKRLEVRLTETGASRPYNPLISFPIDLSKMWKGEEVLVGISSSSGNSKQISSVYSWRFRVRNVPNGMHSQPVDPMRYSDEGGEQRKEHKGSSCPLTVVCGLMLGMACGALVAFIAFFLWTIAANRHNGIPLEYLKHPVGFGYEKAVDVKLMKFMEDQNQKNESFMSALQSVQSALQSVQKANDGQLQLIKDLSEKIGKMSPPQWSTGGSSSSVRIKSNKNRKR